MLKNVQTPVVVSEAQRRENSHAKQRLQKWRRQYLAISQAIRDTKAGRQATGASIEFDYQLQMQLIVLREYARDMMWLRGMIGEDLRTTSYAYASREEVAAAN